VSLIVYLTAVALVCLFALMQFKWENTEVVRACAYDNLVPGFGTYNTLTLRLWSAKPAKVWQMKGVG